MSAIALVAMELGVKVTGSDVALSDGTERVRRRGATVYAGHKAGSVGDADAVVVSTAIARDNPEVVEARRRGIPILHRAEMLAVIMERKKGIAISGTHGKTTTTSMAAVAFERAGCRPTWVVGGVVRDLGSGAAYGEGEYLIAEADESDASFLHLRPFVTVATNIDNDHLDHYGTFDRIVSAFEDFLRRTRPDGFSVLCADDPNLAGLASRLPGRIVTYSVAEPAEGGRASAFPSDGASPALVGGEGTPVAPAARGVHYQVTDCRVDGWDSSFRVWRAGLPVGEFTLGIPGRHNISNATAVIALGTELGLPAGAMASALATFRGAGRRLERMGRAGGVEVVDDYAHHPTEIATTLRTVKSLVAEGRLIVVFQPHRFTRTRDLYQDFGQAFGDADVVVLTDIYPANEKPIPGITGELIGRHFVRRPGQIVEYVPDLEAVPGYLASRVRPGDLLLTMGAGNVRQAGAALLSHLAGHDPDPPA
jgi:UDP-N-acetylmuramate--alanine ligase